MFHEHAVSLCCFGDFLGSYGGAVAELVVSLGGETVYLDLGQLQDLEAYARSDLLSGAEPVYAADYTEPSASVRRAFVVCGAT